MNTILQTCGNKKTVLLGDFNIDVLSQTNTSSDYNDLLSLYGFINSIDQPTYVPPSGTLPSSCLDHIWHNLPLSEKSYVISPGIADHLAVSCVFEQKIDEPPIILKFRDFSSTNSDSFSTQVQQEFLYCDPPTHDVNLFANYLDLFLRKLLDKYFPVKTKTISAKRLRSPWITSDVIYCIDKKHRLHKQAKSGNICFSSYKSYCFLLRNLLDTAEKEYYVNKLNILVNDQKKNWKLLNKHLNWNKKTSSDRFLIDDQFVNDPKIISNEFNRHFIDHPRNISENIIASHNNYLNLIPINPEKVNFPYATPDEVDKEISSLKRSGFMIFLRYS